MFMSYFEDAGAKGVTVRHGGLGCQRGSYSYQFVRISQDPGVGFHIHRHSN